MSSNAFALGKSQRRHQFFWNFILIAVKLFNEWFVAIQQFPVSKSFLSCLARLFPYRQVSWLGKVMAIAN